MSTETGEVIIFPIGDFTNLKEGTVELCVTLKQKLVDKYNYFLFMVDDGEDLVLLQIDWNKNKEGLYDKKGFHNVRLRIKPGPGGRGGARVLSPKINWQPGEHHHIAATWGETGMNLYIDAENKGIPNDNNVENVAWGRENFVDKLFIVINNNDHDPEQAIAPTHCIVRNLRIHNYQKSHADVKESYAKLPLHPKQDEHE